MDGELEDLSWEALSVDILSGMRDWWVQHPKATLREIEQALDERWYRLRTHMLQDLALRSSAAHWKATAAAERPVCPACGTPLILRGKQPRHLKTDGDHHLTLTRSYGLCPTWKQGLSPWTLNWPYSQGTSLRSCKTTSLIWGAGCRLPKRRLMLNFGADPVRRTKQGVCIQTAMPAALLCRHRPLTVHC